MRKNGRFQLGIPSTLLFGVAVLCAGCHSGSDDTYSTTKGGEYIGGGKTAAEQINARRANKRLPNGGKDAPQ